MNKANTNNTTAKIAYLLEDFLTPTTTFITQEVRYLRNCGIEVKVYVAGVCGTAEIDPASGDLLAIAKFSRPVNAKEMICRHVGALVGYPSKYMKTLWRLFRTTWNKPFYLMRSLRYFVEGIYLGSQMAQEEITYFHTHFAGRAATAAWSIWSVYGITYTLTSHAYDLFASFNNPQANGMLRLIRLNKNMPSLLKLKLHGAQRIITISEFNRRHLIEHFGIPDSKIEVIRCGVDVSRFQRDVKPLNDQPVVLSVGGLVEKKGHDVLVRACGYLKDWGCRFQCKIIGQGPLLADLIALTKSLKLQDYVHFCGRVHHSEILKYHKEADIFALACLKGKDGNMDGIPVALMEAMAMQIPVVTTNISGIPELVESGVTGFVVEPSDPKELAERLRQLLDDVQLRQAIGRRGRERVLQEYDQQKNHSAMIDMFLKTSASPGISMEIRGLGEACKMTMT
jgi:colanic acid/amylovoran biosynthesis glycosyltransferase